jgi:lipoprotein NlpI
MAMIELTGFEDIHEPQADESGGMDQLSAHLERGWEQLSKGNLTGARVSASKVLEIDPEAAEGHTLQGAVSWGQGDPEDALSHFVQALELEPDYPEPMLYAAEVLAQDSSSVSEALVYCEQLLGIGELEQGSRIYLEALVLKAELHFLSGEVEDCRNVLARFDGSGDLSATTCHRIGRLYFELAERERCREWMMRALEREPMAECHHYLGLLAEMDGNLVEAISHFRKVRAMDVAEPEPVWAFSEELFSEIVRKTADRVVSEAFGEALGPEQVVCLDYPAPEVVLEGGDPRMPVYLSALPLPPSDDAESGGGPGTFQASPSHVVVYKRNVERMCRGPEDVQDILEELLKGETAKFLARLKDEGSQAPPSDG